MANFLIPFGRDAEKRFPTTDEKQNGFPCGPADQRLFNGLFNRLESEVGEVISFAGLTPDDSDLAQLRKAIQALISAATGGGDTSQFLLMSQARARLPFFPEVQDPTGHLGITSPATGQVRLPGTKTFLHRGIFPVTTVQTDFATDPSKTYHLRWDPTNGWRLRDLSNVGYNPSALGETNIGFDSTYDDMLAARVVTNSSNVPTITNLINLARLRKEAEQAGAGTIVSTGSGSDGVNYTATFVNNFARIPAVTFQGHAAQVFTPLVNGFANLISITAQDRYAVTAFVSTDFHPAMGDPATFQPNGRLRMLALG